MLFILDQPVIFTHFIQPACLPFNQSPTDFPLIDTIGLIAGWGRINGSYGPPFSNSLQNIAALIIDYISVGIKIQPNINNSLICTCN